MGFALTIGACLLRQLQTHFGFSRCFLVFFFSLKGPSVAEVAEPSRPRHSQPPVLIYISCWDSRLSYPILLLRPVFLGARPIAHLVKYTRPMSPSILPGACFVVFGHCSCYQDHGLECWGHRGVRIPVSKSRISSQLFCYRPLQHTPRTRSLALKLPYEMGLKALRAVFNHPHW